MSSFNKVILLGNLTRDPEVRATPKGLTICSFSLAVNRKFTTQSGESKNETTYVDVETYGKMADLIAKYLSKGKSIMVEGRLKLDTWEKDGEKRSRLKVVTETFQFISRSDGKKSEEGEAEETETSTDSTAKDEEVPF